jgi:hypothetical protein
MNHSGPSAFATNDADRPVFVQDWWLDAALDGQRNHQESCIREAGQPVGRLRYIVYRNKLGLRVGTSPFWSHLGGPVLVAGLSPDTQRQVIRDLLRQLPADVSFEFVCDPNADYASIVNEEFEAAGFHPSLLPSYLHQPDDPEILSGMKGKHRAQIRSAARGMEIENVDADGFVDFYELNLPSRSHSPLKSARHILREGINRGQARAFVAVSHEALAEGGQPDAAIACAWDKQRYYYWLSMRRRQRSSNDLTPNPEATKLLILAAVDHASSMNLVFDADSPETVGGRALFERVFAFKRVEHRHVFVRETALGAVYNRVLPRIKQDIKSIFPGAPIHAPRKS